MNGSVNTVLATTQMQLTFVKHVEKLSLVRCSGKARGGNEKNAMAVILKLKTFAGNENDRKLSGHVNIANDLIHF